MRTTHSEVLRRAAKSRAMPMKNTKVTKKANSSGEVKKPLIRGTPLRKESYSWISSPIATSGW
ncbi:hypothetical protein D3C84_1150700 [compost metagenome]